MKKLILGAALAAMLVFASPVLAQTDGSGTTQAPDLQSVGNFREGPPDDDGNPQTLVDYTFDQSAYLRGGNRSSFNLVPLDGGDEVPARGIAPEGDTEGDQTVTVLFNGQLDSANYARGFVDTGIVTSRQAGPNAENPLNINQSASLSNGGQTQNPDLESVTYEGGDIVLFEFDQALTAEDVVQNNSGLRVYFPDVSQASRIREAGATNVTRESPTTLRAQFADDLPEGKTLDQAVGGFVQQGTVQAAPGEGGANNGANAFDELAPLEGSGSNVCAASDGVGGTGDGAGPTEGPDLQSVGNFRQGPATSQGTRTTCVDFTFDQVAYLNGGDKSNFQLVPQDGGDALSGSTNVEAQSDEPGDNIVTVVFSGELSPQNFPRGFVDSNVATSRQQGANPDNPLNVNQSEPISNNGVTENPDLISATFDGGSQVVYEFDEPLTTDDVVQNTSGLRVYFPDTDTSAIRDAGASNVTRESPTELRAFFPDDLPGGKSLEEAAGAFVAQGTVQAAQGSRGGNDGTNAFDELAPLEDSGNNVCAAPEGTGGTGDGAGPTEAPDLQSVGNFRRGPATSQGTSTTCVDFTFDQAAYLNGGDKSNFQLVPQDGGDALSGSTNVEVQGDEPGDNIVTVVFPGDLSADEFPRGYVDSGVVNSEDGNVSEENPYNVNQAEPVSNNGITENPDLVQVARAGDSFIFEFDEPLTDDDLIQNNSGLRIYFPETSQASTIREKGAVRVERVSDTKLRAFFGEDLPEGKTLDDVVGAFVQQGTVQAAQGSQGGNDGNNAFDETLISDSLSCTITGTPGNDRLSGTPGTDVICGLGGNDSIRGLDGDDILRGGAGNDRIFGQDGDDTISAGEGNDRIFGQEGDDTISGGADRDRIFGDVGDDTLAGQGGEDRIFGQEGNDTLRGGTDDDRIFGQNGNDRISGQDGDDDIFGQAGDDQISGQNGDDRIFGDRGDDRILDQNGDDQIYGQQGEDFLNTQDGVGGDLVDGGNDTDECATDSGDTTRNCP